MPGGRGLRAGEELNPETFVLLLAKAGQFRAFISTCQ
jgi:hypothetical protein